METVGITRLEEESLKVGDYEVRRAEATLSRGPVRLGNLGEGFALYKDGQYRGYHMLPEKIVRLPIAQIIETQEFKIAFQKFSN